MKAQIIFVGAAVLMAFGTANAGVSCSGKIVDAANRTDGVYLSTDVGQNALMFSVAAPGEQPAPWEVQSFRITKTIPMFPIYSIEAEKDLRPVDGDLTSLVLTIQSEAVAVDGGGQPAKLTVTHTSLRGGKSSETYALSCVIAR